MRTVALATLLFLALAASAWAHTVPPPPRWLATLIHEKFPGDEKRATCIVWHESRYSPTALYLDNYGLAQINRSTWDWRRNPRAVAVVGRVDWRRIYEPAVNLEVARRIYLHARGWSPWSTRGLCGGTREWMGVGRGGRVLGRRVERCARGPVTQGQFQEHRKGGVERCS